MPFLHSEYNLVCFNQDGVAADCAPQEAGQSARKHWGRQGMKIHLLMYDIVSA